MVSCDLLVAACTPQKRPRQFCQRWRHIVTFAAQQLHHLAYPLNLFYAYNTQYGY